ncbi:MAG: c-type cytochrome [Cyclobacteriaceae bacterium]|nr:c-type cytochrome [Cyclobacteriaceae bacterium]
MFKNIAMDFYKSINKKIAIIPFVFLVSMDIAFAQGSANSNTDDSMIWVALLGFVFVIALLVLMVAVYLLQLLKSIVRKEGMEKAKAEGKEYIEEKGLWSKLDKAVLTQAVDVKDEDSIILDHDYDGIRELDNHLPPWWKYLFYITIIFGVIYIGVYHVFDAMPLQEQEYNTEMSLAEEAKAANISSDDVGIDESSVEYSDDPSVLANGEKVYSMNCAPCHRADGGGGIGPNLTDEYWVNGGSVNDIFKAVKYGFPDKGMISWEPLLSSQQMSDVTSFVMSLKGTNPEGAKAPQGERYVEEAVVVEEVVEENSTM